MYSSPVFLLVPLMVLEAAGQPNEVLLTTVLRLVKLAGVLGPSTNEVLLVEDDSLHASIFLAKVASSVIVFAMVSCAVQLPKG